jgi:pilus assembly protein Flp/PilA
MLTDLMSFVQSLMGRLSLRDESGQALVEYGLIIALIAVACVATLTLLGTSISGLFTTITGSL